MKNKSQSCKTSNNQNKINLYNKAKKSHENNTRDKINSDQASDKYILQF